MINNFGYMSGMGFDDFFFPGIFLGGIIGALLLAFWVWMLIDCLRQNFKGNNEKIIWVLVIIFAKIVGALIYFFIVKNRKK